MKKVLDFIKTHTFPLGCAAVALLAIGAFFFYVPTLFAGLQEQINSHTPTLAALNTLNTEARTLPALTPGAEPQPLNSFPTTPVVNAGKEAVEQLKTQAGKVLEEAVKLNRREPLVRGSLPKAGALQRQYFFDEYRKVTAQVGDGAERGILRQVLSGALPPTQEELTAIEAARTQQILKDNLQTNAQGQPQNQPEVDQMIAEMKLKLPLEQRVSRALASRIYVSPGAVQTHPDFAAQTPPAGLSDTTIFNAQFSLWLQLAVFDAINDANAGAKNVLDAPVKHLVSLTVPLNIADAQVGGFATPGFGAPPEDPAAAAGPVELKPDATITPTANYPKSPLGLASNAMYDPIQVQMVLRVDYRRLPEVLAKLSQRQLLRIRNVNYRTVEAGIALSQGFVYDRDGKTPLVEVSLDCEVIMLRAWTVQYMPEQVKKVFAAFSTAAPAPQ